MSVTREYSAQSAAEALRAQVRTHSTVIRDDGPRRLPWEFVPGEIVLLSAGSLGPADALVLKQTNCFVSEAVLTGESFPVEEDLRCAAASHSAQ